ncbi:hypothetical protein B0H14DRAFT_3439720 [Mycena olivaceomarginata]|nr:hypothetical protein B0H14DRAFT_3439720 [Mycena olivaceomarginata]
MHVYFPFPFCIPAFSLAFLPSSHSLSTLCVPLFSPTILVLFVRVFSRTVRDPLTNLMSLMGRLVDLAGNLLMSGVDGMISAGKVKDVSMSGERRELADAHSH